MLIASLSAEQRGWGRLALSISTNEIFVGCHARWMMCMDRREREKCMSWVCECVKENCARGCWKTNSVCECARVRVCAWKNLHAHKLEHSEWVRACVRVKEREERERDIERTLQKKDWVLYVLATAENLYWRTENECEMDRFLFHAYLITEAVTDGPSASDQSLSIVFAAKFDQKILSRSSQLISKPCSLPFTFKFLSI